MILDRSLKCEHHGRLAGRAAASNWGRAMAILAMPLHGQDARGTP
jgi:hypothetical protein